MSKINVNEIGTQSGTDVAISSGKTVSGTASQFKMTDLVAGDVLYASADDTVGRVPKGTAEQVLTMNAGATAPEFATSSSGAIKKIHYFTHNSRTSGNSTADTNQITITSSLIPLDTTNNTLMVLCVIPVISAGNDKSGAGLRFVSGGNIYDYLGLGRAYGRPGASGHQSGDVMSFQIAAGTIAAGTYTVYYRTESTSSQHTIINPNSSDDARIVTQTVTTLQVIEFKNP